MQNKKYREILIFVAGTTPQIITETLYALMALKDKPIFPDEIYVLTTQIGKAKIREGLFVQGRLAEFANEYGLGNTPFDEKNILVFSDGSGKPMDDIRDEGQNEALGDAIAEFIRAKAEDPGARLHCSLAGGRKTMSFYLGSALQLFGRPWDKLYHVLVTPEFESNPKFYYRPKENQSLEGRDSEGKPTILETDKADIFLAEIPFLSLRGKLSLNGKGYRELIAESQREINAATVQLPLRVDWGERLLQIGGKVIEMVPMQLIVYGGFLKQKVAHCRYPAREACMECTDCFLALSDIFSKRAMEEMVDDYRRIYGAKSGRLEKFRDQWKDGMSFEALRQNISKINRTLREGLADDTLLPFYMVAAVGKHGSKRYGVRLERDRIQLGRNNPLEECEKKYEA